MLVFFPLIELTSTGINLACLSVYCMKILSKWTSLEKKSEDLRHQRRPSIPLRHRWIIYCKEKTGVLFVSSGKLLQYNVSRCTDLDLFRARHVHEIKVSKDTVYVRLDAAQRGLGTGSCGKSMVGNMTLISGSNPLGVTDVMYARKKNRRL